jgi:hypothetical protein
MIERHKVRVGSRQRMSGGFGVYTWYDQIRHASDFSRTSLTLALNTQWEKCVPGRELLVGLLLVTAAQLGRGGEVIGNGERRRSNTGGKT